MPFGVCYFVLQALLITAPKVLGRGPRSRVLVSGFLAQQIFGSAPSPNLNPNLLDHQSYIESYHNHEIAVN